ncbi:MAG: S8 family serine peptidase [Lachnospiraceae bacterium]|nr:S8 family serine peptidase [Lachnospiraceae bacterium]
MKKVLVLLLSLSVLLQGSYIRSAGPSAACSLPSGLSDAHSTVIVTLREGCEAPDLAADRTCISFRDDSFVILDYYGNETELDAFLSYAESLPGVLSAERDTEGFLTAASGPQTDDYFAATQYWFNNTGSYSKFYVTGTTAIPSAEDIDIDGPEGWELYRELAPAHRAIVAVIDTGIDFQHPDLADKMWINSGEIPDNGIDDDGNGYIDDVYGWDFFNNDSSICHYEYSEAHDAYLCASTDNDNHGTHCAGIIAASADNEIGIAGVASIGDIRLMSLKVYGGSECSGSVADAIKAIRYADRMGADVCNISWGFYNYSSSLYTAIARSNMLFVCAAGNDGTNNDETPIYPASYNLPNIISVAYLDENGAISSGSNRGAASVDTAAPAKDVFSTVVGSYSSMSGSSMAAPQVTGIAALLYTLGKGMFASNVKDIILNSLKPVDGLSEYISGGGIPSLSLALSSADRVLFDRELPHMQIGLSFSGGDLLVRVGAEDHGPSGIGDIRYFTGRRSLSYFAHGTEGTAIPNGELVLAKGGRYTFFVSDRAGNEVLRTLQIPDDVLAPKIGKLSVSVNNKMTKLTVSAYVSDEQSGLRTVKYLKGVHGSSAFVSSAVEPITPDEDGKISFRVSREGTYTIYACDNRGNETIVHAYAYIRRASGIALGNTELGLLPGDAHRLTAIITPASSTDRVTFTSSDASVAEVSASGTVKAVAPGTCTITASTSSGKTATCEVTVSEPEE